MCHGLREDVLLIMFISKGVGGASETFKYFTKSHNIWMTFMWKDSLLFTPNNYRKATAWHNVSLRPLLYDIIIRI